MTLFRQIKTKIIPVFIESKNTHYDATIKNHLDKITALYQEIEH